MSQGGKNVHYFGCAVLADGSAKRSRRCVTVGRIVTLGHATRTSGKFVLSRILLTATVAILWLCFASALPSATTAPSSTSFAQRQEAAAAIPLDQMKQDAQQRLLDVVAHASIYRRLPTEQIRCDTDMYLFLIRNPEVVVNIWRLMGVTEATMQRTGPFTLTCDDSGGTISNVELMFGTPNLHVFYAETNYEGPLFARPVKARVVLLLRSSEARDEDGRNWVASTMDAFIRIDHTAANLVARTLQPIVGRTADHNFTEAISFLGRLSETAQTNGSGMQRLAGRLQSVDPPVRREFARVSAVVSQRAASRQLAIAGSTALEARGQTPTAEPPVPQSSSPAPATPITPIGGPSAENPNGEPALPAETSAWNVRPLSDRPLHFRR